MSLKPRTITILVLSFISVTLILAFNLNFTRAKSALQADFETWLALKESDFDYSDKPHKLTPPISIRLSSGALKDQAKYGLSSTSSAESSENVFRILRIMREADLFSKTTWSENANTDNKLALTVVSGAEQFKTHISAQDSDTNVKLKTLLKLLQVYAQTSPDLTDSIAMAHNKNIVGAENEQN